MISVLRTSRLRGPGSLPDSASRAEGIPSGSSAVHAVHVEASACPCPCHPGSVTVPVPGAMSQAFWGSSKWTHG